MMLKINDLKSWMEEKIKPYPASNGTFITGYVEYFVGTTEVERKKFQTLSCIGVDEEAATSGLEMMLRYYRIRKMADSPNCRILWRLVPAVRNYHQGGVEARCRVLITDLPRGSVLAIKGVFSYD